MFKISARSDKPFRRSRADTQNFHTKQLFKLTPCSFWTILGSWVAVEVAVASYLTGEMSATKKSVATKSAFHGPTIDL